MFRVRFVCLTFNVDDDDEDDSEGIPVEMMPNLFYFIFF